MAIKKQQKGDIIMLEDAPKRKAIKDDIYLKIWEVEQRHTASRWTLTTFFLSVSFAIFGIALQSKNPNIPLYVPLTIAIAIYWFTYILFLRFNDFNLYLRSRLREMEENGQTNLDLQTKSVPSLNRKRKLSATKLILLFGIAYTISGIVISIFFSALK